jgi:isopentenyl phosphate kinase
MYTFIKLGGSVITDKSGREAADLPLITRLVDEIAQARAANPALRLIIGHGSGSFGHHYAAKYGVHHGLAADADWMGFALAAGAALRLNRIVVDALLAAGVPALQIQPSAALRTAAGQIAAWDTATVASALDHGLIPIVHGDVAFDSTQGSAIVSTEQLMAHLALATPLRPARIILVGEDSVYTADPRVDMMAERIPLITAANIDEVLHGAVGSHAVDVTGGMRSKLDLMWRLVQAVPGLQVRLIGPRPGLLAAALGDAPLDAGTVIRDV